jgi:hypothetical protein
MKQLENIREIRYVFFDNTNCNISTASGASITVKKMGSPVQKDWIAAAGDIPWPPRSPDLTPYDFYL